MVGAAVGVTDAEIMEATKLLALEGLFVEPSGAVTIAALPHLLASGRLQHKERVVCVLTGSGFKDFERIQQMVTIPEESIGTYEEILAIAASIH